MSDMYVIELTDSLNNGRVKINRNFEALDGNIDNLSGLHDSLTTRVTAVEELATENETQHELLAVGNRTEVGTYCYWTVSGVVDSGKILDNGSVRLLINGVHMYSNADQSDSSAPVDFWIEDTRVNLMNASGLYGLDIESTDLIELFYQTD